MPAGIPVGTLAIGVAGAKNAALLATSIVGNKHSEYREQLDQFRKTQTQKRIRSTRPKEGIMKKLGIIGAGQLAQMLAQAGVSLGVETHCIAGSENDCARNAAQLHVIDINDEVALQKFANQMDVITFENENIPVELYEKLNEYKPVFPSLTALQLSQDRLYEKTALKEMDIPSIRFF